MRKIIKKAILLMLVQAAKIVDLLDKRPKFRILTYHNIQNYDNFEKQIEYLSKSWKFITPSEFEELAEGREQKYRKMVLITFDDGFVSNIEAAKILNKKSIKAIFFVVPKYIEQKEGWRDFLI
jgi:peptidoglycan/xylan/chitin deacetylase (PgdA/CDA1 family)